MIHNQLVVKKERARILRRLYHDLPKWEISIWTGCWMFAIGYSIYQLFNASSSEYDFKKVGKNNKSGLCIYFSSTLEDWRMLERELDRGYLTSSRRDTSDFEWSTISKCFLEKSLPWLCLHTIGTQFFQRQNQEVNTYLISTCTMPQW